LDCGLIPTEKKVNLLHDHLIKSIKAVFITHAHYDHWSYLPWLILKGFQGKIYMTAPTWDIIRDFGAKDFLKFVRDQDLHHKLSKSLEYLRYFLEIIKYGQSVEIKDLKITFLPAGHLLGSSQILVKEYPSKKELLFTGDINPNGTHLIPGFSLKKLEDEFNLEIKPSVIITESTNFIKKNDLSRESMERQLMKKIRHTLIKGGNVLVPCFAIGNAQEFITNYISLTLATGDKIFPRELFIMGGINKINKIYKKHASQLKHTFLAKLLANFPLQNFDEYLEQWDKDLDLSFKHLNKVGLSMYITSGGMLTGVSNRVFLNLKDKGENLLIMTGYQKPGSSGFNLLEAKRERAIRKELILYNGEIKILRNIPMRYRLKCKPLNFRMRIYRSNLFWNHANFEDLSEYLMDLHQVGAKQFFIVHGSEKNLNSVANFLNIQRIKNIIPSAGTRYEL